CRGTALHSLSRLTISREAASPIDTNPRGGMNELSESGVTSEWLGQEGILPSGFSDGGLWVGRHSGDDDVLVFDPAEGDAQAEVISFYSLAKHRRRSFRRDIIGTRIRPVTDEVSNARALKDYARREALQA